MFNTIKNTSITNRLIISFLLILVVFAVSSAHSSYNSTRIDQLHRHNLDFVVERAEIMHEISSEFMSLRWLSRASLMNSEWRETAGYEQRLAYEARITEYRASIEELAMKYLDSVYNDYRIDAYADDCVHTVLLFEAVEKINIVYYALVDRFFSSSPDRTYDDSDMIEYSDEANLVLHNLLMFILGEREDTIAEINASIESSKRISNIITATFFLISFGAVCMMVISIKKSFKDVEKQVDLVEKGDFKPGLQNMAGNELSIMFLRLIKLFTRMADEIERVTKAVKNGEEDTQINAQYFQGSHREVALGINELINTVAKSKEEEVKAAERTKLLFDSAPLLIEIWNSNFELIDFNPYCLSIYGLTDREEYIGSVYSLMPEIQACGTPSNDFWRMQLSKIKTGKHVSFKFICRKPKGELVHLDVIGASMKSGDDQVYVTYATNVTELVIGQLEVQEKIREANKRVELMLDSAPTACFLINKEFEAIDCNMAAVSLFDVDGKLECLHSFHQSTLCQNCTQSEKKCITGECALKWSFRNALQKGSSKIEWSLRVQPNAAPIPCEFKFARLEYKDDYVIAAYIEDLRVLKKMVEDAKRLEIAEENSMAKSRFLARMSHEIRTPITAVMGISEIQLQNPNLPLEIEEAFAKIYDSTRLLYGIIGDVLDISKIEAGKVEIIIDQYEVSSTIVDVVQIHLMYLGSKNIKFNVNVDKDMPAYLIGDELHLKQVLNNILSNAVKYTDEGSITIDIYCEYLGSKSQGESVNLLIRITDTGHGMSADQIEALYNEYARFHTKDNRFTQGTGLGMPIVYSLIELMKGSIKVDSEVNVGTTVTIRLPQTIATDEKLGSEAAENIKRIEAGLLSRRYTMDFTPEPMPYGKVLIVDDVDANLYVAKGLMKFYELSIETATGGAEAVDKVKRGKVYDIIFMDHMMPDMDGFEATKIIRELGYTETIVAFTANALIGKADEFLRSGFDSFLSKPIRPAHLNAILNKFIRDKQPPEILSKAKTEMEAKGGVDQNTVDFKKYLADSDVTIKLRTEFLRTKKNAIEEIHQSLIKPDLKTAHRLAHNLKGLAGLIGEFELMKLAQKVEDSFKKGEVSQGCLNDMEAEMTSVLSKLEESLAATLADKTNKELDESQTTQLFEDLHALLNEHKMVPSEMISSLEAVPSSEKLINQIEDFDYDAALKTLEEMRNS